MNGNPPKLRLIFARDLAPGVPVTAEVVRAEATEGDEPVKRRSRARRKRLSIAERHTVEALGRFADGRLEVILVEQTDEPTKEDAHASRADEQPAA